MSWSIPIERMAAKAKADLDTVARKVAADLYSRVVQMSPVDTGRFRANWNFSIGVPDYAVTANTAAGRGTTEALRALTVPAGSVVYLSNGLPYARRLEYGYSKQAPAGMVRTTVAQFDAAVRRAIA